MIRLRLAACVGLALAAACGSDPDPNQPRDPGRVTEDGRLEVAVGEMFMKDPVLRNRMDRIQFEVLKGVVYLSGTLPTKEEKEKAEELVEYVGGVREVKNHIEIRPAD